MVWGSSGPSMEVLMRRAGSAGLSQRLECLGKSLLKWARKSWSGNRAFAEERASVPANSGWWVTEVLGREARVSKARQSDRSTWFATAKAAALFCVQSRR